MVVEDPQWKRQQTQFLMYNVLQNLAETKGNPLNYVLYKGKHYSVANALCFVVYQRRLYAVIETDPNTKPVTPDRLKKVGEVWLNRKGENDLSDTPEENVGEPYPVYKKRFSKIFYMILPEHGEVCHPMLPVRSPKK